MVGGSGVVGVILLGGAIAGVIADTVSGRHSPTALLLVGRQRARLYVAVFTL